MFPGRGLEVVPRSRRWRWLFCCPCHCPWWHFQMGRCWCWAALSAHPDAVPRHVGLSLWCPVTPTRFYNSPVIEKRITSSFLPSQAISNLIQFTPLDSWRAWNCCQLMLIIFYCINTLTRVNHTASVTSSRFGFCSRVFHSLPVSQYLPVSKVAALGASQHESHNKVSLSSHANILTRSPWTASSGATGDFHCA